MGNGSIQKNGSEIDRNLSLLSSSECIAWLTVMITESAVIVTLNILAIIVFLQHRSLRKRSMYLVINLSVADMLVGGLSDVYHLADFGDWGCSVWKHNVPYTNILYVVIWIMGHLFPFASLINLAAISLERAHATFRPFRHRVIKTWVLKVVIAGTWVTAGLFSTVFAIMWRYRLYESRFYVWSSFVSICLCIILITYTSIAIKVYCGSHPQHHGAASRERKLTKTLFIVTVVSLMLWLPLVVCIFLILNTDIKTSLPNLVFRRLNIGTIVLCFANSLVNPILYTIRMPEFRIALVSLFRRQQRQVQVQIPLHAIHAPGN